MRNTIRIVKRTCLKTESSKIFSIFRRTIKIDVSTNLYLKKCNTYISMNKLILTGLLAAGAMTHIQGAQFAGQENQQQDPKDKSRRPNILLS